MSCKTCEAKDDEIEFLRAMVKDFLAPYKPSSQLFKPSYVNDKGEVVELTADTDTIDVGEVIKDENGEDRKIIQEINVVNEIIGH